MMVTTRFSFTGKVCSGDYQNYVKQEEEEIYIQYYESSSGSFFKIYSWFVGVIFSLLLCCGGCCGFCIYGSAYMEGWNTLESFFDNCDSIPEIMRK